MKIKLYLETKIPTAQKLYKLFALTLELAIFTVVHLKH